MFDKDTARDRRPVPREHQTAVHNDAEKTLLFSKYFRLERRGNMPRRTNSARLSNFAYSAHSKPKDHIAQQLFRTDHQRKRELSTQNVMTRTHTPHPVNDEKFLLRVRRLRRGTIIFSISERLQGVVEGGGRALGAFPVFVQCPPPASLCSL